MKKLKGKMPFITFVCLSILLVILIYLPTSVSAGEIVRCSSPPCICMCPGDLCSCGAHDGACWCICTEDRLNMQCPDGGGGEAPP
jgi:hypothetical protein